MRTLGHQLIATCLLLAAADCREEGNTGTPDFAQPDLSTATDVDLATPPADLATNPDLVMREPVEFMVLRVGDGSGALTATGTAVFVDRHKIADGAKVGASIALPTTVNGASKRLVLSGTAISEGAISRSANGAYVVVAGYDAALGTASLTSSSSTTVNRVIGRIAADNSVDTTTAFDGLGGGSPRGAASSNGMMLWASGTNGIVYTTLGSTAAPTALSTLNSRAAAVIGSQLYVSSGSGANLGVSSVGNGTPVSGTVTPTLLPGFNAATSNTQYGFAAVDRDATPGIDTIYVADERTTGMGGVQRWKLSGTTWMLDGTFAVNATTGARSVAAFVSTVSSGVVLLVTTADNAGASPKVVSFLDTGQAPNTATAKDLVTAPTNTSYRGIALAPEN